MINQQISQFIKERLGEGDSMEHIKTALVVNGFDQQDIEDCVNNYYAEKTRSPVMEIPKKKDGLLEKIILTIIISLIVIGGIGYALYKADIFALL